MIVYLAGPITGLSYDVCTDWRQDAIEWLARRGITGLSPMRGKDYLADRTALDDCYNGYVMSTQKAIVTRDRWDTTRADVVLANLLGTERVSIGTVMELAWADAARTPTVVVLEPGNVHDHAMLREVSGYIVGTVKEALHVVAAMEGA